MKASETPKATLFEAPPKFFKELEFIKQMAASASELPPYFWVEVSEEMPSASRGKPLWTGGLGSGRKELHRLHLGLQDPSSPQSVHKSTYSVAHRGGRYTNDLLSVVSSSGGLRPVTSQQFLGHLFKHETRIERFIGEALYAAYIDQWELTLKPLRVKDEQRWSLNKLVHR